MVVVDFDRLNEVNEHYNWSVGDAVLRSCADAARCEAPSAHLAFRYRDDELVLLVPGDEEDGGEVAERVRGRIAAQNSTLPAVTVSCGVAVLRAPVEPLVALGRVGPALQAAKRAGGNRVVLTTELARSGQNGHSHDGGGDSTACRAALAMAVASLEARDQATAAHSDDVVTLCESIGTRLGLSDEQLDRLAAAAQLHDVGKLAMPTEILNKPGPLNDEEWEIIREHTVIGERMLRAVPEMGAVANMVRHSHESWDGSGYPDGLAGEEIPLASRIILCADAFHAIRSDRPYRPGRSADEALKEVKASAGEQFDPRVVEALVAVARDVRRAATALPRPRRLAALLAALAIGGGSSAYAASEGVRHVVSDVVDVVVPGSVLKPAEAKAADDFSLRPIDEVHEIVPVALLTPDLEFPELRDVAYQGPRSPDADGGISTVALRAESGGLAHVEQGSPASPVPSAPLEIIPLPAAPVSTPAQPVVTATPAPTPTLVPVAEFIGPAPAGDQPEPGQVEDVLGELPAVVEIPPVSDLPPLTDNPIGNPHGEPPAVGNPHGTPPGHVDEPLEQIDETMDEERTETDAIAQEPSTVPVVENELKPADDKPEHPHSVPPTPNIAEPTESSRAPISSLPPARPPENVPAPAATETPTSE